jgi:hypothetical protein
MEHSGTEVSLAIISTLIPSSQPPGLKVQVLKVNSPSVLGDSPRRNIHLHSKTMPHNEERHLVVVEVASSYSSGTSSLSPLPLPYPYAPLSTDKVINIITEWGHYFLF